LILLLTIANLLPLHRVEPYLLTLSNKEDQVYNIIPYTRSMDSQKSITETFVREYVLLRTTLLPDVEEMESRWQTGGDLQEMSSNLVYQDFLSNTGKKLMQRMRQDGLTSNVRILTVNEISDGLWQVEYVVDYYLPSSYTPRTIKYRASLKIQYQPRRVQYKERLKNPVGFKVISYGTKRIKE
jgi:type IV secretory pathway component VirB8